GIRDRNVTGVQTCALPISQSATQIERQIRGLTPWPGAYTFLAGQRVKILASLPVNTSQQTVKPAGTVISVGRKAILVACGKDTRSEERRVGKECGTRRATR